MTPEVATARLGLLGASEAAIVMGGLATDGLKKLVRQKAGERVFGALGEDGYKSTWMDRGSELENQALDAFEFAEDVTLIRQAHTVHPGIPYVAATPDGLLPGRYAVEAKSPMFHVWCDTREALHIGKKGLDAVPSEYRHQCRWQMWVCGVSDGRFVCYHPVGGLLIVPYTLDPADADAMAKRVVVVEGLICNWVDILSA